MDTWVKVVIGGAVAYFAYEMFFAGPPASWTAAGGTAAQWTAIGATGQSVWNAAPAASQTAANVAVLVQTYPASTTAVASTAAGSVSSPPYVPSAQTIAAWSMPAPQPTQPAGSAGGNMQAPAFTPASTAAGSAGGNMQAPAFTPAGLPGYPGVTSLATLASTIQSMAAPDTNLVSGQMSGDHWNYYANLITGKTFPPAYPSGVPMTFATYWAAQSPVIAAQTGLGSMAAGLAALAKAQRSGMGDYVSQSVPPQSFIADQLGQGTPFYFDANTDERSFN